MFSCVLVLFVRSALGAVSKAGKIRQGKPERNEQDSCAAEAETDETPTVGLEPTTTRLRALRSAD